MIIIKALYKGLVLKYIANRIDEDDYGRRYYSEVFEDNKGEIYLLNSVLDKYETESQLESRRIELLHELKIIEDKLKIIRA